MIKEETRINSKTHIVVEGARMHNLKNVHVAIPKNKLVVITGVSGSGKSSLAFDTLYAEGQRRYVESLSSYARQFLGKLDKPDVDHIKGISPAIAIEQKVISKNPRSTVGTVTEIYDYYKLFFARVGKTYSPVSGKEVKRHTPKDVVEFICGIKPGTKVYLVFNHHVRKKSSLAADLNSFINQGYTRLWVNDALVEIEEFLKKKPKLDTAKVLVDRFLTGEADEEFTSRAYDSVETAFAEGNGSCEVIIEGKKMVSHVFNNLFEADGITFEEVTPNLFAFNNPIGACKVCEGYGSIIGVDPDLVMPNKTLSVYDDGIACWRGESMGEWKKELVKHAHKFDFPVHKPIKDLTKAQKELLWTGNKHFNGLNDFFKHLEANLYKIQYRVMLSRYRGKTKCPDCLGTRLRKDANNVKVNGKTISDLVLCPVTEAYEFFTTVKLDETQKVVAKRLLPEITNRLKFLLDVGVGYLTLNRAANTLSGGESQRINLATSLGSSLVGSLYILDEPSIGLHPRDTQQLISVLKGLRDLGNTVVVVEHDEEMMHAADEIIDMGPMAGTHGGQVVFQGDHKALITATGSLTADYLTGRNTIDPPVTKRKWTNYIELKGCRENNLKNIDVKIPLDVFTCITGVSGSGKSTLVRKLLYPAVTKFLGGYGDKTGDMDELTGKFKHLTELQFIDQNPIGKSSRSNPVTYVKAFDEIRQLFTGTQLAKARGYKPSHFSFNVDGGRCENCAGEGSVTIEMQFMADVVLLCDECKGKRYKDEILEVTYNDKSIYDILSMTIDDAIAFFKGFAKSENDTEAKIIKKLQPLSDVGLGYVQLGQSSNTLSGGEAQRIKLASFLIEGEQKQNTLFIFDEPSTGLHFDDVKKLLYSLNALVEKGNSILVIEHNMEIVKCADWVIDLGPEGGEKGGNIVYEGSVEGMKKSKNSYTGKFLK
ncbi:MAG TPA: excinuclease ABC subunit UvrA [Flavobacteriales bacterium]|nr:excinuclease ABC subunit UvrA [Flavobacteriales bacterium]